MGSLIILTDSWFDGTTHHTTPKAIVIANGIVESVADCWDKHEKNGKAGKVTDGAQPGLIDLRNRNITVLPGLIDCHAHPTILKDDYQFSHLRMSSAYKSLVAMKRCMEMLEWGWTTIRCAGDADKYTPIFDVRRAIAQNFFPGPRIVGAGHYLSITGGGGDINSLAPENWSVCADGKIVDGVENMRKAVREEVKAGSDWIKLLVTGAYMSVGDNPENQHFSEEELAMAVSEAARFGRKVMAHAHSAGGIVSALRAGARTIEHGTFIDDAGIALMLQKRAWLVPTLYIGEYYAAEGNDQSKTLDKMNDLHKKTADRSIACIRKAHKAGVAICAGTDYVGWDVKDNYKELVLLKQLIGMTCVEALRSATSVAADMLDLPIGRIAPKCAADVIAVHGNPAEDLESLARVGLVVRNGSVVSDRTRELSSDRIVAKI